ncbi:hypothetical protein LUX12_20570 [Streptomyces somaliensis]|nr:hypothetical protein [Streptomyces somaliensis]MCP9946639.1 hypothetical protein [Streptomyces somaliensis]
MGRPRLAARVEAGGDLFGVQLQETAPVGVEAPAGVVDDDQAAEPPVVRADG